MLHLRVVKTFYTLVCLIADLNMPGVVLSGTKSQESKFSHDVWHGYTLELMLWPICLALFVSLGQPAEGHCVFDMALNETLPSNLTCFHIT